MARIVASIAVRTFAAVQLKAGYCCGWFGIVMLPRDQNARDET
jgi:hypothetical protein